MALFGNPEDQPTIPDDEQNPLIEKEEDDDDDEDEDEDDE